MNVLKRAMVMAVSLLFCASSHAQTVSRPPKDLDLKSVVITMKQESHCGCIGCGCASYVLKIDGNGKVNYEGIADVQIVGKFNYSIGPERVIQIIDKFYEIDFFSLKDIYRWRNNRDGTSTTIDHTTPVTTSITINGRTKSVYDFFGAPERLKELERTIYDLSEIAPYATPKKSLKWSSPQT